MILGRVIGNVVSTIKNKSLEGFKLMLVRQADLSGNPMGKPLVAIDSVDSGTGDLVVMLKEGGSAKMVLKKSKMPVNLVIVGVVDTVDLDGWVAAAK